MLFSPNFLGLSASENSHQLKFPILFTSNYRKLLLLPFEYSILLYSSLLPLSIYFFKKM